jgi:hypothetical protein
MQKKLSLLFIVMHCAMIQAIITPDSEYTRQQSEAYKKALVNALAGNEKAIDEEDQKNKQANDEEEQESRRQQYDGIPGYIWATEPTVNSEIGRKYYEYAQYKQGKNKIDQELSEITHQKKDLFNKEVLPILVFQMEASRFFVEHNCLPALHDCGVDFTCYDEKGLSSTIFTDDKFGAKYEQRVYVSGAKIATEKGIELTAEEVKTIVIGNQKTREFVEGIKDGIEKLSEERNSILNQKK